MFIRKLFIPIINILLQKERDVMSELRKDYILDRWVLISQKRGKRPNEFITKLKPQKKFQKNCAFCPGNEHLTPKETFVLKSSKGWVIRCFKNKYGAIDNKATKQKKTQFISIPAYGYSEIVVDSRYHDKQLEDLSVSHIKDVLETFVQRISFFASDKKIKHVSVFRNHNKEAGTSIIHSHCQIISYNQIPKHLSQEINEVKKHKSCPYCKIIKIESKSKRLCYKNKSFVSFAPFASRYNYEVAIFPIRHVHYLSELSKTELLDLADILKKVLLKLKTINAPYNFYLHHTPHHKNIHFHLKVNPRLNTFGGFELETGTVINSVPPEKAAGFYRR